MSSQFGNLKTRVLMTSSAAVLGLALTTTFGSVALAQDTGASDEAATIVVTGSRIVRRDYTSNSPIITLNSEAFENTSNVAIESTLNKLPQFNPAQNLTGISATDVQPTAGNTIGISAVSLRGLGPNRNLVLVDGRRLTPVNAALIVDVNSIPSAMIDRVETITGGASAVYGADAVGGAVNFILKKNFEGIDIDTQYGFAEVGDGEEFKVSGLIGANFADDRGNVTFGIEHFARSPSYRRNRDFYTKGWADPSTGTDIFFSAFNGYSEQGNNPTDAAVNAAFPTPPPGVACVPGGVAAVATGCAFPGQYAAGATIGGNQTFLFNNDCTSDPATCRLWINNGTGSNQYDGPVDGQYIAPFNGLEFTNFSVGTGYKTNGTHYFVTSPLTRYSMYGAAHYDFNEWVTAYITGSFESFHTHTLLFPSPFIFGWTASIPYSSGDAGATAQTYCLTQGAFDCSGTLLTQTNPPPTLTAVDSPHPVPAALAALLDSRASPNADWLLSMIPGPNSWFPSRQDDIDTIVFQVEAGLKGNLPYKDWTYDLYFSEGQSSTYDLGGGYASLARFQALVRAPNYGAGAGIDPATRNVTQGNLAYPAVNGGFGSASPGLVHCTSGFGPAIFSNNTIAPSKDCIDAINAKIQSRTLTDQKVIEVDFQGGLFELPAGEVRAVLGASYRSESIIFTPDILQGTQTFLDQVVGVYPASEMDAQFSAREGYGELLVPVLGNLSSFVKKVELELGWRYSSYDVSNETWTYKGLIRYEVNDWLRFRAGYNLATRAPNLYELNLGLQEVFAGGASTVYGDPCSIPSPTPTLNGTNAPYGANHNTNAANAANALAICEALMGGVGSAGSTFYYSTPGFGSATGTPTAFIFTKQFGNPDLQAEKGHTWTAGVVLSSPWDHPLLNRLSASIDWFDLRITNGIQIEQPDTVRAACLNQDVGAAATFDDTDPVATAASVTANAGLLSAALATAACQKLERNPITGQDGDVHLQFGNGSTIDVSGVDLTVNWSGDFADMGPANVVPGTVGVNVIVSYLNYYDSKASPGAPWVHWKGSLGPTLNGTNPGAYEYRTSATLNYALGPASMAITWRHLPKVIQASAAEAKANGAADTTVPTDSYDIFDFFGNYKLTDNLTVRAGIDNLFNVAPKITGANTGVTFPTFLPTSGQGVTNTSYYDALGRRFYFGAKIKY